MKYEWDENKNRSNRKKHGISFDAAVAVFNDPFILLIKDRTEGGEQRWHAIGTAQAAILLGVHVYRKETEYGEEESTRIISAREASKHERRRYFEAAQ